MALGDASRKRAKPQRSVRSDDKRRDKNATDQKALIQQCWAVSGSHAGFEAALTDHGYRFAKRDRRGHVIVCHDSEVFTVASATDLHAKAETARLGSPDDLQSVAEAMEAHRSDMRDQFGRMAGEARTELATKRARHTVRDNDCLASQGTCASCRRTDQNAGHRKMPPAGRAFRPGCPAFGNVCPVDIEPSLDRRNERRLPHTTAPQYRNGSTDRTTRARRPTPCSEPVNTWLDAQIMPIPGPES